MKRWLCLGALLVQAAGACNPPPPVVPDAASPPSAAVTFVADEPARRAEATHAFATGFNGAVSSAEAEASAVGLEVLERGGNAVDAAVAVAFALGVTLPSAGNIGGGGFMLVRSPDGRSVAIDYREVAPLAAQRDMFLDAEGNVTDKGQYGPLAAGIPGVVAGLARAHEMYGTLAWAELLAPAVRLAEEGCVLDRFMARDLSRATQAMRAYAARASGADPSSPQALALARALKQTLATFGKPNAEDYAPGERWKQPALAETLRQVARHGASAFYRGTLARRMASEVQAMGGIWSSEDLERYHPIERAPIAFDYHGHEVLTMPPPSGGGIVLRQILAGADALELERYGWDSVERIHYYVEIARRAFADRNRWLGDPDFVDVPLAELLDPARTARRLADIDPEHASASSQIHGGDVRVESKHTTHFSVVDASGMAVANTFTLNTNFGALVQIPATGITLNNEMDDFTAKPGAPNLFELVQSAQNAIEPGKRMSSSMSPTIVLAKGKLRAVLGSPGGSTIPTTVAQILLQLIDHGRSLRDAVAAPRIHHQWLPDEIWYEPGVPAPTLGGLRRLGHALATDDEPIGHANCIEVDPASGQLRAVADVPRGGGGALAY